MPPAAELNGDLNLRRRADERHLDFSIFSWNSQFAKVQLLSETGDHPLSRPTKTIPAVIDNGLWLAPPSGALEHDG